jgi:hypothetical protein
MSAPQIPNLLSLRGRGGGGLRGRRGGGGGFASPAGSVRGSNSSQSHDATIQGTDTDASVSRLSAVELGYLEDPFARYFVQQQSGPPVRRLPIINRGEEQAIFVTGVSPGIYMSDRGRTDTSTKYMTQELIPVLQPWISWFHPF